MMASPPMLTAVLWPRPEAVSAFAISVVMPPERDMMPMGPGWYALRADTAAPPMPPTRVLPGDMHAEAVRADDARAVAVRVLDDLRHFEARDALGDDDEELDAVLDRLEGGVADGGGRHGEHATRRRAASP